MAKPVYVPILRSKQGEFTALKFLKEGDRGKVFPLLEIVPPRWEFDDHGHSTGVREKETPDYCRSLADHIAHSWGTVHPMALDLTYLLNAEGTGQWTTHPLTQMFGDLNSIGVKVIPVINGREGQETITAIQSVIARDHRGLVLRVPDKRLDPEEVAREIESLLKLYRLDRESVDLVIDWGMTTEHLELRNAGWIQELVMGLPRLKEWRTFTVAGSSFPSSTGDIKADTEKNIHRSEWAIWRLLTRDEKYLLERRPLFGDYTINGQSYSDPTVRLTPSANVRYTSTEDWVVYKGSSLKPRMVGPFESEDGAFLQFVELAKKIVADTPVYRGETFSHGDRAIHNYANGKADRRGKRPTGTPSIWKGIGVNHHIAQVLYQLAN